MKRLAALALASAVLLAGLFAGLSAGAPPAWDISGTWVGFVGDLKITQADGKLTGTFRMKFGCVQTYRASGTISGSAVSLALAGRAIARVCAATQTLSGTVDPSGRALVLVLANAFQTSPAGRFTGKARKLGGRRATARASASTSRSTAGRRRFHRSST